MSDDVTRETSGPTLDRERIDSLDVLRGFALMGILVMNIQSFSMPANAYLIPNAYGTLEGLNGVVWLVGHLFFDLKFMAMFSMMFGAGIVLMSQHRDAAGSPVLAVHYRRMALLLLFGLTHAYGIWYGDILVPYAICGCFVVWARLWKPRNLVIAGVILIVIGSGFDSLIGLGTTFSEEVAEEIRTEFSTDKNEAEIEAYRGAWIDHLPLRAESAAGMQIFILPAMFFWRLCGLMCIGMALFKWNVLSAGRTPAFYLRMITICGFLGLPLVAFGAWQNNQHDFDPAYVMGFGALPNYYGSVLLGLMWMGVVMLACTTRFLPRVQHVLACYGRMAFTNYIGQSLLATFIFYGYGFGLFGSVSRVDQAGIVAIIWAIQLAYSPIWLRYFRFGPLEWLWRSGVYMKPQPMLRRAQTNQIE